MSNTSIASRVSGRMSSRGWALALGIGAVVLAAILLVVYLDRYRDRVSGENAPTQVLVAKRTIPRGTPGSVVATQSMYVATTLPQKDVKIGAVEDPQYLVGRAAVADVLPGQQITAADFAVDAAASIASQLSGTQRALSMSIDAVHGSLSQLRSGDVVDVYVATAGVVKLWRSGVKILAVPGTPGPSGTNSMILRVEAGDVADWAYAIDNSSLWFVIRPVVGAKKTPRDVANASTLLR